jgi:hypothetical protein
VVAEVVLALVFFVVGWVAGPAVAYVSRHTSPTGVTLSEVRNNAAEMTLGISELFQDLFNRPRRSSTQSDGDRAIVAVIVGLAVVTAYLTFRVPVLVAIILLSLLLAILATVCLIRMSRAGVIASGRGVVFALLGSYLACGVGLLNVVLLWYPPAGGAAFQDFISMFESTGAFASVEGILFVAYQVMGAVAFLMVGLFSTSFSIALMSAVNIHNGAWGGWLHQFMYAVTSFAWSSLAAVMAIILSAFSVFLSGGWAYSMIGQWQGFTPTG